MTWFQSIRKSRWHLMIILRAQGSQMWGIQPDSEASVEVFDVLVQLKRQHNKWQNIWVLQVLKICTPTPKPNHQTFDQFQQKFHEWSDHENQVSPSSPKEPPEEALHHWSQIGNISHLWQVLALMDISTVKTVKKEGLEIHKADHQITNQQIECSTQHSYQLMNRTKDNRNRPESK